MTYQNHIRRLGSILIFVLLSGCGADSSAIKTANDGLFDSHLVRYRDLSYSEYLHGAPARSYQQTLSFDPTTIEYYQEAADKLDLNEAEKTLFQKNGFVSIDHDQRYSFASAYYGVWTRDLPIDPCASSLHDT